MVSLEFTIRILRAELSSQLAGQIGKCNIPLARERAKLDLMSGHIKELES